MITERAIVFKGCAANTSLLAWPCLVDWVGCSFGWIVILGAGCLIVWGVWAISQYRNGGDSDDDDGDVMMIGMEVAKVRALRMEDDDGDNMISMTTLGIMTVRATSNW